MNRSALPLACLLALALEAGFAQPLETGARRYDLAGFDTLELELPLGWQDAVDELPGGTGIEIELRPREGAGFEAFLTPQPNGRAPGRVEDAEALRAGVREAALRQPPGTVAVPLELRRLQGADGVGFYFVATEYAPAPEEFPILVQGALLVGGLVLRFEILSQHGEDSAVTQVLAMLQGAVHRDHGGGRP